MSPGTHLPPHTPPHIPAFRCLCILCGLLLTACGGAPSGGDQTKGQTPTPAKTQTTLRLTPKNQAEASSIPQSSNSTQPALPGETPGPPSQIPGGTPSNVTATTDPPLPSQPGATGGPQAQAGIPAKILYSLNASLDYAAHHLTVTERIDYTNNTTDTLGGISLVVEPSHYPGAFQLNSLIGEYGPAVTYFAQRDSQIVLYLDPPLAPGERFSVSLSYELQLPPTSKYTNTRPRPFGYTDLQANLGDWYPFVPPYDPTRGWLVHEAGAYGEHLVYEVADFEVAIQLVGALQELVIAASAPAQVDGEWLRYRLNRARGFAFSASPHYQVASSNVSLPDGGSVSVMSYSFPFCEQAGERVLQTSAKALQVYGELFGPYPYPSLSAVQADFLDGMEYDGLYFLSKDFYNWYKGGDGELLVTIAAHETAHQWWYALVGNDQALEPWLDEALCTYCERLFFERAYPGALDWWWTYRVNYFQPHGKIDINIYDVGGDYGSYRAYRDVVYLNGANFFEDLRTLVGDQAFFAFLRAYRERYTYGLATARGFFETLEEHTSADLTPLVEEYFRDYAP